MLVTKLVIRVLDGFDNMLGWAEVQAEARGDGILWVSEPQGIPIDRMGTPRWFSIHWCDVNVEIRSKIEYAIVKPGEYLTTPANWGAIVVGPMAKGLPPVTIREPIKIAVPVGNLGSVGNA